jgi:hypothetical protein
MWAGPNQYRPRGRIGGEIRRDSCAAAVKRNDRARVVCDPGPELACASGFGGRYRGLLIGHLAMQAL